MTPAALAIAATLATIPAPPPHLDIAGFDADLELTIVFAVDPDRTCNRIGQRMGLAYVESRGCAVLDEGEVKAIIPRPGTVPDECLVAILRHELGHVIGNLLGEESDAHVGWVPAYSDCGDTT